MPTTDPCIDGETMNAAKFKSRFEDRLDALETNDPWHTVGAAGEPAFAANWQNTGGSNRKAGFRRNSLGDVELAGWLSTTAAVTAPSTIFTLPAGWRPDANVILGRSAGNSGGSQVAISIVVNTNGTVQLTSFAGSVQWGNVGLEGISFPLVGPV